ncbi:MAG: HAD hydrolase-like protein [Spirochaetia bacterium]|nr:HAD hydrolase-like protein [Spirochaetia bacterium]
MRVILFDMMDTLVHDNYLSVLRQSLPSGHTIEQFRMWRDFEAFEAFECGEISEAEYFRRFYKPETPEDLREIFVRPERVKKELFRSIRWIDGVPEILDDLRSRDDVKLAVASNYGVWYRDLFLKRPDLPDRFHYLFFSCEMGVRKPAPAYYTTIEESLARVSEIDTPLDLLFIDDREINLLPAAERGWRTHLMRGAQGLRDTIALFVEGGQDVV